MFKNHYIFGCSILDAAFMLSATLLWWPASAFSAEVVHSQVSHDGDIYKASIEMQINAPVKKVYALFTDFNYLTRLSDNITNSDIIDEDPPEYTVRVESHNCFLFFCMDIEQTQLVTELGEGHILVEDIEGESDFVFATSRWHIRAYEKGTRVTFSTEMQPNFWLPPFFGPLLFETSLIEETQNMIEQLEKLATHE